jgi:hypothetical protein
MVVNDLKPSMVPAVNNPTPLVQSTSSSDKTALAVGGLALVLSLVSLGMQMMKKKAGTTV